VLLSLFVAVLAGKWAQQLSQRLLRLKEQLSSTVPSTSPAPAIDELSALERAVSELPLELLQTADTSTQSSGEYAESGLLYIHLDSLGRYVDTLDEQSLLKYTNRLRQLAEAAARLYGGQLSVARQFGLLLSFSEPHSSGSPGFRAASCGWLLGNMSRDAGAGSSLKQELSMACGLGESTRGSAMDIYPDLYNQHVIDELSQLAAAVDAIQLTANCAADADIANRCQLGDAPLARTLLGFEEPYSDLLERQRQLLLRELATDSQGS